MLRFLKAAGLVSVVRVQISMWKKNPKQQNPKKQGFISWQFCAAAHSMLWNVDCCVSTGRCPFLGPGRRVGHGTLVAMAISPRRQPSGPSWGVTSALVKLSCQSWWERHLSVKGTFVWKWPVLFAWSGTPRMWDRAVRRRQWSSGVVGLPEEGGSPRSMVLLPRLCPAQSPQARGSRSRPSSGAEPSAGLGAAHVFPLGRANGGSGARSRRLPATWRLRSPGSIFVCLCVCCWNPLSACFPQNCALLNAWAFPVIWGVFFSLVFARTLTLLKCSRSVLCMSYYSRMHPGAVISSGNPPTVWKMQHMHMDILIKEKNLIFFTV